MILAVRSQTAMDLEILHTLNRFLAAHDGAEDPLALYVRLSVLIFAVLLAGLALAGGPNRAVRRRGAVLAGTSAAVALLVAQVLSRLVDRPRPFVADPAGVQVFTHRSADPSFPSDHATLSFAIAVSLLLYSRRWGGLALALAVVLSVGRVAVGAHYPTDVLGGAALGSATAVLIWLSVARRPLHALADLTGGWRDRAGAALARGVRVGSR